MRAQVLITNWLTTYGEVIVRVPPRAFGWKEAGAVGGNVTYVVCAAYFRTACPMIEHAGCAQKVASSLHDTADLLSAQKLGLVNRHRRGGLAVAIFSHRPASSEALFGR